MSTKSVFLNSTSGDWGQPNSPPPSVCTNVGAHNISPTTLDSIECYIRRMETSIRFATFYHIDLLVELPNTVGWCSQHALAADTLTSEWQDSIYSVETTLSIPIEQSREQERLGPKKLE